MPSIKELLASIEFLKEQLENSLTTENPSEEQRKRDEMRIKILREKEKELKKKLSK